MRTLKMTAVLFISVFALQCSPPTTAQLSNPKTDTSEKEIKSIDYYDVSPTTGDKNQTSSISYDKSGKFSTSFYYTNNETKKVIDDFDDNGNLTKQVTTDENGNVTYLIEQKYEGENLVERKTKYGLTKYAYNQHGHLILEEEYNSDGTFDQAKKSELEYLKGTDLVTKNVTYKKDGDEDFKKYTIDTYVYENEILKEKHSLASFYEYSYSYTYHPNGNLKETITISDMDEKIITKCNEDEQRILEGIFRIKTRSGDYILDQKNKWTYDKYGNEIMYEGIRNDKVFSRDIREITYY